MKLLFISQNFPYPPYRDGARLKAYNLIKYLSKYNEIFLVTFFEPGEEEYINEIKAFCVNIITVPSKNANLDKLTKYRKHVHDIISPKRCDSNQMHFEINKVVQMWTPDVVHVDLPMMSQYWKAIDGIPRVIASHDTLSLSANKNWKSSKGLIQKAMWYWLYKQRIWIEKHFYPHYDVCTVVSNEDSTFLKKHCPELNIKVIPNGVDIKYFDIEKLSFLNVLNDLTVGIFGSMSFVPNVDGVMYFVTKIYTLIRKKLPGVRIFIVGRNPHDDIKSLANNKNIIVTGEVDDIREYYKKVSVVIAPIRLGSGIKNTILQAMSMARPIVTSPQAVKAIAVEDGVHCMIAESPECFADKIVNLLNNPSLREALSKNARDLAVEKYSWETHANVFQSLYEKIIQKYSLREVGNK